MQGGRTRRIDTRTDTEKAFEQVLQEIPVIIKMIPIQANAMKVKYDALVAEGFTPEQALEIVKTRPIFD